MKELFIRGTLVAVSDEVYAEYLRPIWREKKRRYSEWRCRDGKGVRCKGACTTCPFYRSGRNAHGSTLSLEVMADDPNRRPYEPIDETVDVEEIVAHSILMKDVREARAKLPERDRIVLDMVLEDKSDTQIGARLGISKAGGFKARNAMYRHIAPLLEKYKDYFEE
ncbi:MAG: hypothetical protein LUD50_06745 [Clostridia bacterium]|nr:hypothetical protein [Clostridia bacterium]